MVIGAYTSGGVTGRGAAVAGVEETEASITGAESAGDKT